MVLDISTIPAHLQANIAKKIDFFDLKELELASTCGKEIVGLIRIPPIVEALGLWFTQGNCLLCLRIPNKEEPFRKDLNSLTEVENLPRFLVPRVDVIPDAIYPPEGLAAPVLNERNCFLKSEVLVSWMYLGQRKEDIMSKLAEVFIVGEFRAPFITYDPDFLSMPAFRQIKTFSCSEAIIPDDVFLSMKTSHFYFSTLASFPNMGPTLRTFIEQCFSNQREIGNLNMAIVGYHVVVTFEDLFSGLEQCKLLWSMDTHESSDFAYIPKGELEPRLEEMKYYSIRGGEKKLIVAMTPDTIHMRETEDENEAVMFGITPTRFEFI